MNARRVNLASGLCLAFLSFTATACGGDGGNPRIKSFEASSSNLPLPGGEVTLTWDVKGEEKLELRPFPGVVHGSAITLNVTESTDFTLVAKHNGRSDEETLHVGVGEPFAIAGRLLRPTYGPASGFGVHVTGVAETVLTDAMGNFRVEGVVAPYELAIIEPESPYWIVLYRGLTRPDPTLLALNAVTSHSTDFSGAVSGVPFPTPTPPPAVTTRLYTFMADGYYNSYSPNATDGTFATSLNWGNDPESVVKVTTLRWTVGTDSLPATFPGYARTTQPVSTQAPLVVNPSLAPVGVASLAGSVDRHESIPSAYAYATIDYASLPVPQSGPTISALADVVDLPGGLVGTSNSFQRSVPDVEASYALTAYGSASFGSIYHTRRNLAGGASEVVLDLPQPPRVLLPVQGAVVSSSTQFSLASSDEMLSLYTFYLDGVDFYTVYVVTEEDSISFPDLSELGLSPEGLFEGSMYVQTYGPFGSLDEAAGPMAFIPTGDDSYRGYASDSRTFSFPSDSGPVIK